MLLPTIKDVWDLCWNCIRIYTLLHILLHIPQLQVLVGVFVAVYYGFCPALKTLYLAWTAKEEKENTRGDVLRKAL